MAFTQTEELQSPKDQILWLVIELQTFQGRLPFIQSMLLFHPTFPLLFLFGPKLMSKDYLYHQKQGDYQFVLDWITSIKLIPMDFVLFDRQLVKVLIGLVFLTEPFKLMFMDFISLLKSLDATLIVEQAIELSTSQDQLPSMLSMLLFCQAFPLLSILCPKLMSKDCLYHQRQGD